MFKIKGSSVTERQIDTLKQTIFLTDGILTVRKNRVWTTLAGIPKNTLGSKNYFF
jgi:hypothetical protein